LEPGAKAVVTAQHCAEFESEEGAVSQFQDLLAEMPLPEKTR
jgi:hypothetical protein